MMTPFNGIDDLLQQRAEWAPWLAVVRSALDELKHPEWAAAAVRIGTVRKPNAPLLARSTVQVDRRAVRRTYENVMTRAAGVATRAMASLQGVTDAALDPLAVLEATLNRDHERLAQYASAANADADAFRAVAALVAMPLLHARNQHARSPSKTWSQSYCPICGGWPAFAEVRGIERSRYLRCADCGSEWQATCLRCTFCDTTNHDQLASLIPEQPAAGASIDACNACLGYIKVFATLRGVPSGDIALHDIATAELDIAAVERGYRRPTSAAYLLDVKVTEYGTRNIAA